MVLAGCKAWLEQGVNINLIGDKYPHEVSEFYRKWDIVKIEIATSFMEHGLPGRKNYRWILFPSTAQAAKQLSQSKEGFLAGESN